MNILSLEAYNDKVRELQDVQNELIEYQRLSKEARAQGDLSENAEFDNAERNITIVRNSIKQIRELLDNSTIDKNEKQGISKSNIVVNCTCELYDMQRDTNIIIKLVSDSLGKPPNKASINSNFGRAAVGKQIGEIITFQNDSQESVSYKVLSIT